MLCVVRQVSMRLGLTGIIAVAGLALVAACSSPSNEPIGVQELRTAPPTTVADTTIASSTTVAATTSVVATTVVAGSTTIPAASLKTEDELKIEYVITEFNRRDWNEKVNRTFDIKAYDGLIEGKQLENVKQALAKRQASTRYILHGTILETIVMKTTITGETAIGIACERNDLQVWDSKGSVDKADDVLIDGSTLVQQISYELQKRGDSWLITQSLVANGDCSGVF